MSLSLPLSRLSREPLLVVNAALFFGIVLAVAWWRAPEPCPELRDYRLTRATGFAYQNQPGAPPGVAAVEVAIGVDFHRQTGAAPMLTAGPLVAIGAWPVRCRRLVVTHGGDSVTSAWRPRGCDAER